MKTRHAASKLVLIATTLFAVSGFFVGGAAAAPAHVAPHIATFTAMDSGKTIAMKNGTTFKVSLQNCGDCGDIWEISHPATSAVVKFEKHQVVSTAKPPAVGGEDHTIWTFKADGKGKTTVRMVEKSAEKGNQVIKRFNLTIEVA